MNRVIAIISTISSIFILNSCKKEIRVIDKKEKNTAIQVEGLENNARGSVTNNMVMYWNEKASLVLNTHINPGMDSRLFAIIQIAVHDALNAITPKYELYALNAREKDADPNAAVASAAYWAIKGLNKQGAFPIDTWYAESLATIPDGDSKEKGILLGKTSAEKIIATRANDGVASVTPISLYPLDGDEPGEYRSTLPFSNPILNLPHNRFIPNWGTVVQPFVTQSNYQFRPPGPYPVNSSQYTNEYNEVKNKGAMTGSTRTPEEQVINAFWFNIKQHIVWNNIVRKIVESKNENLDAWKTARLFALVHTALADGASAMLEAVYYHYNWRPETAIRIEDDGNTETTSDPSWVPSIIAGPNANPNLHIYTPGVPEYPSFFGIAGGIVGEILLSVFQSDDINIEITSEKLPGTILTYRKISKLVNDNGYSKILSGWTFRKSVFDGIEMGKQIAQYIFQHSFTEE